MVATMEPRTVQAQSAPRRRPAADTPARWVAALERAVAANLAYMQLAGGDGAWAVASTRDPETGYVATTDTCTCPAGRAGDPCCCHRALVRALLGLLPPPAAGAVCATCLGTGHVEEQREEGGVPVAWVVPCGCPAADAWVDAMLGAEDAAETAYAAHYHAA